VLASDCASTTAKNRGECWRAGGKTVSSELAMVHPRRRSDDLPAPAADVASIQVIVVDGHPVTRWGLGRVTNEQPDMQTVGEAGSAAEALALTASLSPDVVTIGTSLRDRDGIDLAGELRDRYRDLGIVILSARGEDETLFRALDSGASAFVSKQASAAEILGAIRHSAVAALSFSAAGLSEAWQRRSAAPQRPLLSPRESQVLALLQEGQTIGEVAKLLHVSLSTAKTHVARVYEKLGATNRAQALMTAVRLGLEPHNVMALAARSQSSA
jgi:DNA-binding NarL/FixJ family response regulator